MAEEADIVTPIESQFDEPECHSMTEDSNRFNYSRQPKGKWLNHETMLNWIRTSRPGTQGRQSDGFMSVSHLVSPAYECECGFSGLFESEACVKCGRIL